MTPANHSITKKHLPLLLALFALCLFCASCGKKADPQPRVKTRSFELQDVAIEPTADCLSISGKLSGNAQNLERFRLDLGPVNSAEDCPGCPFLASKSIWFTPEEARLDEKSGAFSLNYCPAADNLQAPAYRWRLFGINAYDKIQHASTVARLVVMPPKAGK